MRPATQATDARANHRIHDTCSYMLACKATSATAPAKVALSFADQSMDKLAHPVVARETKVPETRSPPFSREMALGLSLTERRSALNRVGIFWDSGTHEIVCDASFVY